MAKPQKSPALYEGLVKALRALDQQIAREMQRTPAELEVHGVNKWKPLAERVEIVTALLLDAFNDRSVELDSVLVMSQAFVKALYLLTEDLGLAGLGEMRREYSAAAFRAVSDDAARALSILDQHQLS